MEWQKEGRSPAKNFCVPQTSMTEELKRGWRETGPVAMVISLAFKAKFITVPLGSHWPSV